MAEIHPFETLWLWLENAAERRKRTSRVTAGAVRNRPESILGL